MHHLMISQLFILIIIMFIALNVTLCMIAYITVDSTLLIAITRVIKSNSSMCVIISAEPCRNNGLSKLDILTSLLNFTKAKHRK